MTVVCSLIAIDLAMKGDVITAIIAFILGGIIDAIIISELEN